MEEATSELLAFGEVAFFSTPSPDHPERNEDAAVVVVRDNWSVLVVSDGAGGTSGGAQAASMTTKILQQALLQIEETVDVRPAVLDAIETAGTRIRETLSGALATIAVVILDSKSARSITVGDSICLVIGGRGKLKYRSIAHGPTGFAEEAGLLRAREAMEHEERHLVSNMLGLEKMRIELGVPVRLAVRDTVVVASDGLFDNVRVDEIAERARIRPLGRAVDRLASLARDRMAGNGPHGHADDLTIVAFRPASKR
ncbi:MAG: SpoIIE family protein phosphatase [Acidobacteria bacterium]|nr:SpoIIE family protein phosphatase [Acidobacteriota bacterium]NIM61236.1 SpoIIE family protein phosphatase [Acidobacteriota bacterium]NIO59614.1 SpoIIE family protein phosphatase [Acidobacteriota bacterium]NIQ30707.1 SpoIIE family protein phosphatase [Acidobacteriota bacterium]NIQ85680.1 SpoIIE family protein phosphatase [Acidobacteriota bacterium]